MIAVYSSALRFGFRGLHTRDGVLLRGAAGWGEFSPFWDYDDATCVPWLRAAVEAATLPFPDPVRDRVAVNVTVPAVDADTAHDIVAGSGCSTAKVKVAQTGQVLVDDLDRVAAVRAALGPEGHVRVDANGAWSLDQARDALPALDRAARGLQYAEQPVASVADMARLRRVVDVPLAADESIRRADDPYAVRSLDAADLVVLKVQPLGGVRACLRLARDLGMPVVVSSALESSIGIAQGVALAAALPGIGLASGLATVRLFADPVTSAPLLPVDGHLPIVRVTPDRLAAVDPALEARWRKRLARVAELARIDLSAVLA